MVGVRVGKKEGEGGEQREEGRAQVEKQGANKKEP